VTFWILNAANDPIQDVKTTGTIPSLTYDSVTSRTFSVLYSNNLAHVGTYRIAYQLTVPSYANIPMAKSATFTLTIIDPCLTTTLVTASPFLDFTYRLNDPWANWTWKSDADLGLVAINPKTCGNFDIKFWLVDSISGKLDQDITLMTNLSFEFDKITRSLTFLGTDDLADIGKYLISY
jgi:hypothetical protein